MCTKNCAKQLWVLRGLPYLNFTTTLYVGTIIISFFAKEKTKEQGD